MKYKYLYREVYLSVENKDKSFVKWKENLYFLPLLQFWYVFGCLSETQSEVKKAKKSKQIPPPDPEPAPPPPSQSSPVEDEPDRLVTVDLHDEPEEEHKDGIPI